MTTDCIDVKIPAAGEDTLAERVAIARRYARLAEQDPTLGLPSAHKLPPAGDFLRAKRQQRDRR